MQRQRKGVGIFPYSFSPQMLLSGLGMWVKVENGGEQQLSYLFKFKGSPTPIFLKEYASFFFF